MSKMSVNSFMHHVKACKKREIFQSAAETEDLVRVCEYILKLEAQVADLQLKVIEVKPLKCYG